jgi:GNAT superfamily N-acetyltransferase
MLEPPNMTLDPYGTAPLYPQPLLGPRDGYAAIKQIDGLGGEWSFDIFRYRALNFHEAALQPALYIPASSFDRMGLEAIARRNAEAYGATELELGHMSATFDVFPSFFDSKDGRVAMPSFRESPVGYHTVKIVGVEDKNTLIFQHGWSGWAKGDGIGYISRKYLDKYGRGLWAARRWNTGPMADSVQRILEGAPDTLILWRQDRPHGQQRARRADSWLRWRKTWDLESEQDAEVLTLEIDRRSAPPVRVAVAIMVNYKNSKTSSLSDLFVWPPYRRHGFGRELEAFARRRAKAAGSIGFEAYVWDADSVKPHPPAITFLQSLHYSVEQFTDNQFRALGSRAVE